MLRLDNAELLDELLLDADGVRNINDKPLQPEEIARVGDVLVFQKSTRAEGSDLEMEKDKESSGQTWRWQEKQTRRR